MTEETIVRENLMTVKGYAPYCGGVFCFLRNPRTEIQKSFIASVGGFLNIQRILLIDI